MANAELHGMLTLHGAMAQAVPWGGIACLGADDIVSDAQQRAQEAVRNPYWIPLETPVEFVRTLLKSLNALHCR